MTYLLVTTFYQDDEEIIEVHKITGNTFDDILSQINTHPQHLHNLRTHKRSSVKDAQGLLFKMELQEVVGYH